MEGQISMHLIQYFKVVANISRRWGFMQPRPLYLSMSIFTLTTENTRMTLF